MRVYIYGTILMLATATFSISLLYLDTDPYDPIGSRLMSISMLSFITAAVVSVFDIMISLVLWIVRTFKK